MIKKLTKILVWLLIATFVVNVFGVFVAPNKAQAAEATIDATARTTINSNKLNPVMVWTSDQIGYMFYVDSDTVCGYSKTTNGGTSWGAEVDITAQADCVLIDVWYDRWTPGGTGTVIHIAFMDNGADDVYYDTLDTNGDSNGTEIEVETATTTITVADNVTITKSTTGVLYVGYSDLTAAAKVRKCSASCNVALNWSDVGTSPLDLANDYIRLVPLASGNIMLLRDDISADNVQSNIWNGSAWAGWVTIESGVVDSTTYLETLVATVDRYTNNVYIAYGDDVAGANIADIHTAVYSGSWTTKTNVITDANTVTNLDIALDEETSNVYVAYLRGTAGSSMNAYWKVSTDGMTNWSGETQFNTTNSNLRYIYLNMRSDERIYGAYLQDTATNDGLFGNTIADIGTDITVLTTDKASYPTLGETITVDLTARNNSASNITASTLEYVFFLDTVVADNQPTAGETYITNGCAGSAAWSSGLYTHQTIPFAVNGSGGTNTDNWNCTNSNFPQNTTYHLWAKWYKGSVEYDTAYVTFTSIPTLNEILFMILVGLMVFLAYRTGRLKLWFKSKIKPQKQSGGFRFDPELKAKNKFLDSLSEKKEDHQYDNF